MNELAVVLYYTNQNRYSFNAILGALETTGLLKYIDIYFFDPTNNKYDLVGDIIKTHNKVIMLFSFFTTQIWNISVEIKRLKNKYGGQLICLAGGPHPTGMPKETLMLGFDYVLIGEGEKTLNDFLERTLKDLDVNSLDSIAYLENNGQVKINKKAHQVILDQYYPFCEKYRKFGPIEITRGCPYGCSFCQTTRIFGAKVRHRSISFVEDILEIMKYYGLKDFRAITPNALSYGSEDGKVVNLEEIYKLMVTIKRHMSGKIYFGSFPSEVRPEHVTEESIKLLKEFISNDNVILGAQTGSAKILEACHRKHSIDDVYNAVEILTKYSITPSVDFMFGLPGEGKLDIDCSIKVMKDLIKMGAKIHAHTFMPLPQTPYMYEKGGTVSGKLKQYIKNYVDSGVVYGNWGEQAVISKKIENYIRTKEL